MMNAFQATTNGNGKFTDVEQISIGKEVELKPDLGNLTDKYLDFCRQIGNEISDSQNGQRIVIADRFRNQLLTKNVVKEKEVALLFAKSVILDLIAQGWTIRVESPKIFIKQANVENESKLNIKDIIRNTHLLGRNSQLKEKSVQDFVHGMERRRLTAKGWHSIYSLMRDGEELANKLKEINHIKDEIQKLKILSETVSPYLQFVEPDSICKQTGLRLGDIWRYFRHTWVNEYKSVPGRSLMILIRDAAAPNHPVIGIAALGSSVVQHKFRDLWIGWHKDVIVNKIIENISKQTVEWLLNSLQRLIDDIYFKDLLDEKILTRRDIKKPSQVVIQRLLRESDFAIKEHRKEPQRIKHNGQKKDSLKSDFWEKEAKTYLFRSKRCKQLSKLLNIRQTFQENGLSEKTDEEQLKTIFQINKVQSSIAQLVRMIKAEHVGIDMMDITVCGAIAPYNALLGGKLVCMLLCSPEVTQYYAHRYGHQTSIIASAMKGKPVTRKPNLVLLCTTSLYGVGSSQYNRVKIPLNRIGVNSKNSIVYEDIGESDGYGTYQFSRSTIQFGSILNSRKKDGRHVNSIFGEGVNPLMRKIRESLDFVGLNSDELLQHGNKRVTYGIQLARNFREILLGRESEPVFFIPTSNPSEKTAKIADYWRERWLLRRVLRPETLEEVSKHILSYPPSHGAMVPIKLEYEMFENYL